MPDTLSGVVAIAAGWSHSLALKSDGTVVAWGSNWDGESTVPENLSRVVAIAANGFGILAIVRDAPSRLDPPRLEIARAGDAVLLRWPAAAGGYVVESTPVLTPPAWETAAGTPVMVADHYELTESGTGQARFFRLRKRVDP